MDLELGSNHVLITGGSKGIGLACAAAFLAEGARVTLVSRSEAHLMAAQARLRSATPGAVHTPSPSGPRWAMASHMADTRAGSTGLAVPR